ncbi:TPA: hypothetical protein DCZ15_00120 [Candidatus Falkowbacteria bacterium]|nr:hypothetical protein [Candidatus Falkowbacteria bacterium]
MKKITNPINPRPAGRISWKNFLGKLLISGKFSRPSSSKEQVEKQKIRYAWLNVKYRELVREQQRQAEIINQLTEENKNLNQEKENLTYLFSMVSHDLRGAFGTTLGISRHIVDGRMTETKKREFLNLLLVSQENNFQLLDDLLSLSLVQLGKLPYMPRTFNLRDKLTKVIRLLDNRKQIKIENTVGPKIEILADEAMVGTILQNFLTNAIKFTKSRGTVQISVETLNKLAKIIIADNGIGMNQDTLKKIAVAKHRSTPGTDNEKGSGLGLLICQKMVKNWQGEIFIESEPNKGSRFSFTVPLSEFGI